MRFAFDTISAVRRAVGEDFVVGMRLCADEFVPGGLTTDDTQEIARRLVAAGSLDYISVSAGMGQTPFLITCDMNFPPGLIYRWTAVRLLTLFLPIVLPAAKI